MQLWCSNVRSMSDFSVQILKTSFLITFPYAASIHCVCGSSWQGISMLCFLVLCVGAWGRSPSCTCNSGAISITHPFLDSFLSEMWCVLKTLESWFLECTYGAAMLVPCLISVCRMTNLILRSCMNLNLHFIQDCVFHKNPSCLKRSQIHYSTLWTTNGFEGIQGPWSTKWALHQQHRNHHHKHWEGIKGEKKSGDQKGLPIFHQF